MIKVVSRRMMEGDAKQKWHLWWRFYFKRTFIWKTEDIRILKKWSNNECQFGRECDVWVCHYHLNVGWHFTSISNYFMNIVCTYAHLFFWPNQWMAWIPFLFHSEAITTVKQIWMLQMDSIWIVEYLISTLCSNESKRKTETSGGWY